MSLDELRHDNMARGLEQDELENDPLKQFELWYRQVNDCELHEPSAMTLATVDTDGQPYQRHVLLKIFDERGFVFFTNYGSRKAQHIEHNAHVSLMFPWYVLGRQVNITGLAEKVPTAESIAYFATRPRGSQIGAWASEQSSMISSRSMLESMVDKMKQKFADGEVPLPSFWGGYRVIPSSYEFWQGRDNRLHDRFIYTRENETTWKIARLSP